MNSIFISLHGGPDPITIDVDGVTRTFMPGTAVTESPETCERILRIVRERIRKRYFTKAGTGKRTYIVDRDLIASLSGFLNKNWETASGVSELTLRFDFSVDERLPVMGHRENKHQSSGDFVYINELVVDFANSGIYLDVFERFSFSQLFLVGCDKILAFNDGGEVFFAFMFNKILSADEQSEIDEMLNVCGFFIAFDEITDELVVL